MKTEQYTLPQTNPFDRNTELSVDTHIEELTNFAEGNIFQNGTFIHSSIPEEVSSEMVEELELTAPVDWPLGNIVSAVRFDSWEEGNPPNHLKDGVKSIDVMRDYANRDTPIPPIDKGIDVYFYTDDEGSQSMFSVAHNAHRVGAAKLKNQAKIGVMGKVRVFNIPNSPTIITDKLKKQVLDYSKIFE